GRRYAARARELDKPVTYIELEGVGHGIDQKALVGDITDFLLQHERPPELDRQVRLHVGGYVQTRRGRIELSSLAEFAVMEYSLDEHGSITPHPKGAAP